MKDGVTTRSGRASRGRGSAPPPKRTLKAWLHRRESEETHSEVVLAIQRATALLRGGVAANRVWRVLGNEDGAPVELARVAQLLGQGVPSARALAEGGGGSPEWRVLAATWHLAESSGAPIAAALDRLADALVALDRLGARRQVLLAGPRATIRLVAALPFAALLMASLLGFDPVAVLLSPLGLMLAVLGGVLLLIGVVWARRLTERLAAAEWVSGLECELCWVALCGGCTPSEALLRVADAVDEFGADWVRLSALRRDRAASQVMRSAQHLGTSVGDMLLTEAAASRARAHNELEREAERLAVRVLLPIGICVLPSFIVLGVLPVLFSVVGALGPLGG